MTWIASKTGSIRSFFGHKRCLFVDFTWITSGCDKPLLQIEFHRGQSVSATVGLAWLVTVTTSTLPMLLTLSYRIVYSDGARSGSFMSMHMRIPWCYNLDKTDVCCEIGTCEGWLVPFHLTTPTQGKKRRFEDRKGVEMVQSAFVTGEPKMSSDKDEDLQSWRERQVRIANPRGKFRLTKCKTKYQFGLDKSREITQFPLRRMRISRVWMILSEMMELIGLLRSKCSYFLWGLGICLTAWTPMR